MIISIGGCPFGGGSVCLLGVRGFCSDDLLRLSGCLGDVFWQQGWIELFGIENRSDELGFLQPIVGNVDRRRHISKFRKLEFLQFGPGCAHLVCAPFEMVGVQRPYGRKQERPHNKRSNALGVPTSKPDSAVVGTLAV